MRQRILSWMLAATLVTACGGGRAITSTVDDAAITAQVKTALLNDRQVNATKIDVSTSNGVVTVSGVVRSQPEHDRVISLARGVNGVKDVKANLTVGG